MKIIMAYEGLYETADLRPKDLLRVVVNVAGVEHTVSRLFSSFSSSDRTLHLLKCDGHFEYLPIAVIKQITVLAHDAQLAFQYLSSLEERYEHSRELLQSVATLTETFAEDIKQRCHPD